MAQRFAIHSTHPQARLVRRAADIVRSGGLVAYPTDSCYALGCLAGEIRALERLRRIRGIDERHHLTLMCRDLSEIARYAMIDDARYRILRQATPGSYTFILPATREVPRRLLHPRKRTVGVRIPEHVVAQALLAELGEPLQSSTLLLPDEQEPLTEGWEIKERLDNAVDAVVDSEGCGTEPTTVIDFSGDNPEIIRRGAGDPSRFE
jgi:tRNA threonylcarbamoyl adenosine modification protein (Sua5/YciO/YrdC/YwlC family)